MAATIVESSYATGSSGPSLTTTPQSGDVIVVVICNNSYNFNDVSGLGATWTRVAVEAASAVGYGNKTLTIWRGVGATEAGEISVSGFDGLRQAALIRGTSDTTVSAKATRSTATTAVGPTSDVNAGTLVLDEFWCYAPSWEPDTITHSPATGWTDETAHSTIYFDVTPTWFAPTQATNNVGTTWTSPRNPQYDYVALQIVVGNNASLLLPSGIVGSLEMSGEYTEPAIAVEVDGDYSSASVSTTPIEGDVLIAITVNNALAPSTSIDGCGATWTKVDEYVSTWTGTTSDSRSVAVWKGLGATEAGTVTPDDNQDDIWVCHISGASSDSVEVSLVSDHANSLIGPQSTVGPGQVVIDLFTAASLPGYTYTPSAGWVYEGNLLYTYLRTWWAEPTEEATHGHTYTTYSFYENVAGQIIVGGPVSGSLDASDFIGTLDLTGHSPIAGPLAASGIVGTLDLSGDMPPTGQVTLDGLAGSADLTGSYTPPIPGSLSLDGYVGSASLTGQSVAIDATGIVTVDGLTGNLDLTGTYSMPEGTLDLDGTTGTVDFTTTHTPPPISGTLSVSGLLGSVDFTAALTHSTNLALTGYLPEVSGTGTWIPTQTSTILATGVVGFLTFSEKPTLSRNRWAFHDTVTDDVYTFRFNPKAMTSPLPEKKLRFARGAGTQIAGTLVDAPTGIDWTFSGTLHSKAEYTSLDTWAKVSNLVRVTDHLGRIFEGYFTSFEGSLKNPSQGTPFRGSYVIKMKILRQILGP